MCSTSAAVVGHWSVLLGSVRFEDIRVTGLDREQRSVEEASARARSRGVEARLSYRQGHAQRLPFPDDSLDLTTCQPVLIHLPDAS